MRPRTLKILSILVAVVILLVLSYLNWIGAIPYEYIHYTTMLIIAAPILGYIIYYLIKVLDKLWQRHKKAKQGG